ncbi:MAG: HAMP domain-containing histidine kinase [Nitrosarchaeum sp.]|nr:HAMP domain-containing histidine kinase [Nitrosarchaeum sp.]
MKKHVKLYLIPSVIGLSIFFGVLFTYFQIVSYEEEKLETFQDEVTRVITGIIERREGRVETIGYGIIGYFEGSESINQDEFRNFCIRIFQSNPEITNIFVLKNNMIEFSYPNESFIDEEFDVLFPNFPEEINGVKTMNVEFFMDDERSTIVSIPFDFFISTEFIPGNDIKINLFSNSNEEKILYQYSRMDDLVEKESVNFTKLEIENALQITEQTSLYGHNLKQNYQLHYTIWSDVFVPDYLQAQITLIGGVLSSIVISVLIFRANTLKQKVEEHSEIVEQKNKELENIRKSKDEFITMVVHDLKNPLVPIQAFSDILLSKRIGDLNEKQIERINSIKSSAVNLQKLIQDLLDVNKLDLGKLSLSKAETNISDTVKTCISNLRSEFSKKEISIKESIPENIYCFCDKMRIEQVLTNILLNALDFVSEKTGEISISLESNDKMCKIIIKDNGVGMEKRQLENLFTKFFQGNPHIKRTYGGSGLGLSVSHGIISQHGGRIWAESEGIGKGSQFFIELPIR